jgi:hypothetical protein
MTDQQKLFFDDANDALRTVVQALGGSKAVGAKIWPDKAPEAAGRQLADCLNAAKPEKLSIDQILLLLRWGHDLGCHVGMQFLAQEAGYEIRAITPDMERDRLADAILEGARMLERAVKAAERLPTLKAVA